MQQQRQGNKGEVIYGSTTPATAKRLAQNLWIDTTSGKNTPKRWDGNAWSIVTDKAATDAQSAANAAQATATEALGKANTATSNIATIKTDLSAVTTKANATASSVSTLQTTVGENTASIQTAQSSVDGLNAQWSVKSDVNGLVGGIGFVNNGASVDIVIRGSTLRFAPAVGSYSAESPITVLATPTTINGMIQEPGAYVRSASIMKAAIDTLHVAGNAITAPTSAFTEAAIVVGDSYTTIQQLEVPSDMGHTMLTF